MIKRRIDFDFRIDTDLLQVHFIPAKIAFGQMLNKPRKSNIYLPDDIQFDDSHKQIWLQHVLAEALRWQAKDYLPKRVLSLAAKNKVTRINKITIKKMSSRWGSCSSYGNLNFSLYLMTAPSHLIDYVILHELAHLTEMNHGPQFWKLVDQMTEGKAKLLEKEMKVFGRNLNSR